MSFVSFPFFVFLTSLFVAFQLLYKLAPKAQWVLLLAASYVFYLFSSPKFVFFLLFSTATTWFFPLLIGKAQTKLDDFLASKKGELSKDEKKTLRAQTDSSKRRYVFLCVLLNVGVLFFMKYTNFFITTFNDLGFSVSRLDWLILPLGISFYTFQSVGYCIDVYRGVAEPERNFFKYALYVSFFPQICQGPIGRYPELAPQLYEPRPIRYESLVFGSQRMLLGYFKKLVVANNIAGIVDYVYANPGDTPGAVLAFATFLYAIQLYADFSGYMDIGLGASQILGIKLAENFRTPYFSTSIAEYWRRWHITLGAWFRDYVYYSLLRSQWMTNWGKRIGKKGYKKLSRALPTALALLIVWLLIGFWHGASWNFIVHGLYHGSFIILAVLLGERYAQALRFCHIREDALWWRFFKMLRTFFIVCVGYVLFRADSLGTALDIYGRICSVDFVGSSFREYIDKIQDILSRFQIMAACLGILLFSTFELLEERKRGLLRWFNTFSLPVRWGILYLFIFFTLGSLKYDVSIQFLYFNF